MRKTLLDKCEEVIDCTTWPFIRCNLSTDKIFNDLIQFHGNDSLSPVSNYYKEQNSIDGSQSLHSVSASKVGLKGLTPINNAGRNGPTWGKTPINATLGAAPSQLTGFTAVSS